MATGDPIDGRRARRERNRRAVIEAMFSLVQDGKVPPAVDDIADRAGVSVSSVFRNFDGLADLQRQALDEFQSRFADLFVVDDAGSGRPERIAAHVRSRVQLSVTAGGLIMIARSRALDHEPMVDGVARLRSRLAEQTHQRFAVEIDQLTPADAANLTALIDATTSPEAFDVMTGAHARSPRQVSKAWTVALGSLLEQWAPAQPTDTTAKNLIGPRTTGKEANP